MVNLPLDGEQTDTHTASGCGPGTLVVGVILAGLCKVVACAAAVHGVSTGSHIRYVRRYVCSSGDNDLSSSCFTFVCCLFYLPREAWLVKKIVQPSPEVIGRRTMIL